MEAVDADIGRKVNPVVHRPAAQAAPALRTAGHARITPLPATANILPLYVYVVFFQQTAQRPVKPNHDTKTTPHPNYLEI